eukprot:jgi/Astpho2/4175/e_gw1.00064.44.1_t
MQQVIRAFRPPSWKHPLPFPCQPVDPEVALMQEELRQGEAMAALRRFNDLLKSLPADRWEELLLPVMNEFAFNLESFNPAFTATLLKVQCSMGYSDYIQRDEALRNLIQPLAGEYGMHNGEPQGKTHRLLFSEFYQDVLRRPLEQALAAQPRPAAAVLLFQQMMRDISGGGGHQDPIEQGCYALGYNLAIEYLADYEKTWMLDSFKALNARVLAPAGRGMTEWMFLEVHAEGEKEHAAIGHNAVLHFVPAEHEGILRKAMRQHDQDFAAFYNKMADLLEQP